MAIRTRNFALSAALAFVTLAGCAGTATEESTGQMLDDSVITTKVKAAIFDETSLKSFEISVTTYKGVVHLTGTVESRANVDVAGKVAKGVAGVVSVTNDLQHK